MLSKLMLKKLGMILLAMSISALLSSCLVDKQKVVEKIARTTDTLRIYKPNDSIDYDIRVDDVGSGTTQYGTLKVKWESTAAPIDPITPTATYIYPVLKETTTLTYDDNTSGYPDVSIVRYISQIDTVPAGPNQGSIILHAIDDGTGLYWPYDPADVGIIGSPVIAPIIFDSPMALGVTPPNSPLEFSVMEGCAPTQCGSEIYRFRDNFAVEGDTREITTDLGIFTNPFELSFSGGSTPKGILALEILGDIRDACGTSSDQVSHSGNMFVMPEIGIIKIENLQCTNYSNSPSTTLYYTITARATSFNFQ
jgi:hypothetical protein